jgi:FixJ family two-component response regulator
VTSDNPVVLVLDDDPAVGEALSGLLMSAGLRSEIFTSPQEFLRHPRPAGPACLILDVQLRELNGLELQTELAKGDPPLPIIFVTGHGTIPMSVRAMKRGAIEFLTKPFDADDLLDAVRQALDQDRLARDRLAGLSELQARLGTLTPREREVFWLVVTGQLNKQIAAALGCSEQTVKVHRGRVMRKLAAGSVADLVRLAERLRGEAGAPLQPR